MLGRKLHYAFLLDLTSCSSTENIRIKVFFTSLITEGPGATAPLAPTSCCRGPGYDLDVNKCLGIHTKTSLLPL